jgi:hypothetical protein
LCRNCLLKHVIEGKIGGTMEVTERQGRCKVVLDNLKDTRGYWVLKEEALNCTLWRTRFGRGYGPVLRPQNEGMNEKRGNQYVLVTSTTI